MPLVTERIQEGLPGVIPDLPEKVRPPVLDVAASAFRQANIVSSLYDRIGNTRPDTPQEGYDPWDDIAGFGDFADRFIGSESPEETAWIKRQIASELKDREVLKRAGGWGFAATIAAGAVDPATIASMMIPVAAPASWGTRGARIRAGVVAQASLDSVSEAGFHQLQETRTIADSALNIGGGALLTGLLGAVATRVPKSEFDELAGRVAKDLAEPDTAGSTVGAARVGLQTTLEDETLATGGEVVAKSVGRINPLLRLFRSPVVEARRLAQEIVDVPFMLNKNKKGMATAHSVEARVNRRITRARVAIVDGYTDAYKAYRERIGQGSMKLREFGHEVTKAMRRGDYSEIPEVMQVAKTTRKLFDADKQALQSVGALPEEIELVGAESYFPRVYDHNRIAANRLDFEDRLYRWYQREGMDPVETKAAVADTVNAIMGTRRGMADVGGGPAIPAPLKARILSVPDEVLEPYLVSDFEYVLNGYLRKVTPQIEFRKTFGSTDLRAEMDALEQAYNVKIERATSNEAKERLRQRLTEDIRDLTAMRDRVLGDVGPRGRDNLHWVQAQRLLRAYNYVRMLGMQTVSSVADSGKLVARYGLGKTAGAMRKFLTNVRANKIAREDAKRMGTALDWVIDSRGATLAEIGDDLPGTRLEQLSQIATQRFTRYSGMATWNSTMRALTSILEQDAILRGARTGKLTAFQKGRLAQYGIGDDELRRIAQQFEKHGEETEGMLRARTDLWDDREMARRLEESVVQASDVVVLSRGAGDLPLVMDKELGKTILQFKSFGMASVTRTLVPVAQGLAHGDLATINGVAVMLALGGLSYTVREIASGREPDFSSGRMIAESLNWSGLLAYTPDIYDPVAGLFHGPRISRYTDRAPVETLLGPSFGTATELYRTTSNWTDLGVTASDIHQFRKLLPYQNVFWLRRVINALEGEAAEAVGAEGARRMDFAERIAETQEVKD